MKKLNKREPSLFSKPAEPSDVIWKHIEARYPGFLHVGTWYVGLDGKLRFEDSVVSLVEGTEGGEFSGKEFDPVEITDPALFPDWYPLWRQRNEEIFKDRKMIIQTTKAECSDREGKQVHYGVSSDNRSWKREYPSMLEMLEKDLFGLDYSSTTWKEIKEEDGRSDWQRKWLIERPADLGKFARKNHLHIASYI